MNNPPGSAPPGATNPTDEPAVLPVVAQLLAEVLGEEDPTLLGITEATWLGADLDLGSLELVYLGAALEDKFGDRLEAAQLFRPEDSQTPADITVGELVDRILAVLDGRSQEVGQLR